MKRNIPDELRCTAIAERSGVRCERPAKVGTKRCDNHPYGAPEVQVAVPASKSAAKVKAEMVKVIRDAGIVVADPEHLEPVEVMSWVMHKAHWIATALEGRLMQAEDLSADSEASVIRSFLETLTHVRKAAVDAESAGMQRRKATLAEGQVQAAFLAIDAAIRASELPEALEQRLRANISDALHGAAA